MRRKLKLSICILISLMMLMSFSAAFAQESVNENDEFVIGNTRAARSFYDSRIVKIFVGNWRTETWVPYSLTFNGNTCNITLPKNYSDVKIQTLRWGLPHDTSWAIMDNQDPYSMQNIYYYDSLGNICTPGSTIYGVREENVWSIPSSKTTSQIKFECYKGSAHVQKICNITWE